LILPLLVSLPVAGAGENHDAVVAALEQLDAAQQDENWHFAMRVSEDGEERVIRHDPLEEPYQQRTLVSVDGEPPEEDDLDEFREQEEKRVDERDPQASYSFLVDPESLARGVDENGRAQYTFSPRIRAMDDARDKLRGSLLLDTASGQIDRITVFNVESLSPAFSVTLEQYRLIFLFRDVQGARLLERMESHATGRAGFLKRFDSRVVVDFSDYRKAASQIEAHNSGGP